MDIIISWCNNNNGFTSAVLSLVGLLISLIAIIVSINTSRLPYKKKLKINASFAYIFTNDSTELSHIAVDVVNVGNAPVLVNFLGLGIKDGFSYKRLYLTQRQMNSNFVLNPAEMSNNNYHISELKILTECGNKRLYALVEESSGKVFVKKFKKCSEIFLN